MVFGQGINDIGFERESYASWHSMHRRCYSAVYQKNKPTYIGCSVAEDWKILSNYDQWFNKHFHKGFQLDKDLLFYGNKIYSEDTCCFLPNEINGALRNDYGQNGLPPGVSYKTESSKYIAQLSQNIDGKRKGIHLLSSNSIESCAVAYQIAKKDYLCSLAEKWKNFLTAKAYNALLTFNFEKAQ